MRCQTYVHPNDNSEGGFSSDKCLQCGIPWMSHKNIGPGWPARSEAMKIQLGMYPNIILGEN